MTSSAFAQEPVDSSDELVVTAQRRSERIQDVPLSIAVITPDRLENARSAGEVTQYVANASAATYDGHLRPFWFIRGVGTADVNPNTVQATGIYYDDVYMSAPVGNGFPLFDLERVELLKGPQGTLYGKNTTAGLMNFISKKPSFSPDGYVKADLGNFDTRAFQAVIGGPVIGNNWAARASITYETRDSYFKNRGPSGTFPKLKDLAGRFQLLGHLGDGSELLLNIHGRRYSDDGAIRFPIGVNANGANNFGYVPLASRDTVLYNAPSYSDLDQWGAFVRYERQIGGLDFTSISALDRISYKAEADADYTPLEIARSYDRQTYHQESQEFRLASPNGGRLEWIVGLHGFWEDISSHKPRAVLPGGVVATAYNNVAFTQKTESYAIFGSATFRFTDRLKVQAGIRWTSESKAIHLRRYVATAPVTFSDLAHWWELDSVSLPLNTNVTQDADNTWDAVGYDVTPQYEIADDVRIYGRVAKGFRAGSYSTGVTNQRDTSVVKPEILTSYEIGIKSEWFNRRLILNAATYRYDYDDVQVNITTATPTGTIGNLTNGARGRVKGAELEVVAIPVPAMNIRFNAGYNNAKYISFVTPTGDFSGNKFPRAPDWSGSAGIDYAFDLGSKGGTLIPSLNVDYRSSFWMFGNSQVNPILRQKGYTLANAQLSYASADQAWKVSLYGKNITNTKYALHRIIPSNGAYSFAYGAEPTYGVSVTRRW